MGWRKLLAFAVSASLASMAGVLYMHTISFVEPANFGVDLSILVTVTLIIGGSRRLLGALFGAAFVLGLPEFMHSIQQWQGMIYGGVLLVVILLAPGGIVSLFEKVAALAWRLRRRKPAATEADAAGVEVADPAREPAQVATPRRHLASDSLPVLELAGLHVDFGGLVAVDDVSISVEPGTVVGLIGPNGAGKTTVFNAISGFVPARGDIRVGGVAVNDWSTRRRALAGVGRTFQNLNLHADRSALDHVLLGMDRFLRYRFVSEALRAPWVVRAERELEQRAHELLERLGLGHVSAAPVQDLPYGLQKRIDVARALATRPKLLLLDEPAAGLPSHEAEEMLERALGLADEQGATVIIIEHNVELVSQVSQHLVVMDSGSVLASGDPATTLQRPEVVAAYLGE